MLFEVYFQFGKRMAHWIFYFFSICFVFSNLWYLMLLDGETYTPPYFIYMPDCVLNSSFSTIFPGDLLLTFPSKMIKRNLEQHNWGRMRKKGSKAFTDFLVALWYLYLPPLKKHDFMMFWYLCHTCVTDWFGKLTFLLFHFYGKWLTRF